MKLVGQFPVSLDESRSVAIPEEYLQLTGRQLALLSPEDSDCLCEMWGVGELEGEGELEGAIVVDAGEAGRVTVPRRFLEDAASSRFVLCGIWDHLELWEESAWNEFCETSTVDDLLGLTAIEPAPGE